MAPHWHHSGDMSDKANPRKPRNRLSADVPEAVHIGVRRTASAFYGGGVSETVTVALEVFDWVVDAKSRGKKVVATDVESLPATYEEPMIRGLDALGQTWTWLVRRDHPWRRQLWIKGRNIPAGDLARTAAIEQWSVEETAAQYDIPIDAVAEALRYAAIARELIDAEEAENRLSIARYEQGRAALSR